MTIREARRSIPACAASVLLVFAVVGCGGGGDTVAVDTTAANPPAEISLDRLPDDYCERAAELSNAGALRLDRSPGTAAAGIDALGDVAPPSLEEDFEVVRSQLAAISEAGTEGAAAALTVIELLVDRDFLVAFDRIERTTFDECGVRLDAGMDDDAEG